MPNRKPPRFQRWLKMRGMSVNEFAQATGISYNTVVRWAQVDGIKPRWAYARIVREKFPDCPLVSA